MTDDIRLSFAHPHDRSEHTRPDLDRISVRDMVMTVEIGAFQAERGTTQRIRFNVVVEIQPWDGPLDDDVDRILSYDKITEAIEGEVSAERLNLLETLAERVADRILQEPQAARVFVRIEKLDRGPATLGVEIMRVPGDGDDAQVDLPKPLVVFLDKSVAKSDLLPKWIDAAAVHDVPVIFCVDKAETSQVPSDVAQRRIDLLSMEQNAWEMAARDDRCAVVASRTELDWGLQNNQISIWAPSKMVLDAVDAPVLQGIKVEQIVMWFAQTMDAVDLIAVGPSRDWPASVRRLDGDKPDL